MTKTEPVDELVPRILESYAEKPRGWRVLSTPKGDMLVLGPDSSFQMKLIPLSPQKMTGVGVEMSSSSSSLKSIRRSPEFGLRPLSETDIEGIIKSLSSHGSALPQIQTIIQRNPLTPLELEQSTAQHLLSGPVLTRPDFSSLSPEMIKLQTSLEREAMENFRKRYPMRAGMYF